MALYHQDPVHLHLTHSVVEEEEVVVLVATDHPLDLHLGVVVEVDLVATSVPHAVVEQEATIITEDEHTHLLDPVHHFPPVVVLHAAQETAHIHIPNHALALPFLLEETYLPLEAEVP